MLSCKNIPSYQIKFSEKLDSKSTSYILEEYHFLKWLQHTLIENGNHASDIFEKHLNKILENDKESDKHTRCHFYLAVIAYHQADYKMAIKHMKFAANKQISLATFFLYTYSELNNEFSEAQALGKSIIDIKDADTLFVFGRCFYNGIFVPINLRLSFQLNLKAADLGSSQANYHLSYMYKHGLGTSPDEKCSAQYLDKAATMGLNIALREAALNYLIGSNSFEKNTKKANEYFEMLSALGDEEAIQLSEKLKKQDSSSTHSYSRKKISHVFTFNYAEQKEGHIDYLKTINYINKNNSTPKAIIDYNHSSFNPYRWYSFKSSKEVTREQGTIYIELTNQSLEYELINIDNKLCKGSIPIKQLKELDLIKSYHANVRIILNSVDQHILTGPVILDATENKYIIDKNQIAMINEENSTENEFKKR